MTDTKARVATFALGAALVAALTACAPESGVVTAKVYDDPDTWTTMEPIHSQQCTSRYDSLSKTTRQSCRTTTIGYYPLTHYDPAHWHLRLDDGQDSGWVDVDETTFHAVPVGVTYNRKTGEVT